MDSVFAQENTLEKGTWAGRFRLAFCLGVALAMRRLILAVATRCTSALRSGAIVPCRVLAEWAGGFDFQ